jgi:hypothetical protein
MIFILFILFFVFLIFISILNLEGFLTVNNDKIKVIVYDKSFWEKNFLEEILPDNVDIIYTDPSNFTDINFYKNNNVKKNKCILVFSSNIIDYNNIKPISSEFKPLIIIHFSDEDGNKEHYLDLANDANIIFRQYHHSHYHNKYDNINYIPLGYIENDKIKSSLDIDIRPINERKYVWSFVGGMKKDREVMINTFKNANLGEYYFNNGIKPEEMYDIYNNSIFIPNGRGNVVLDCLRLYEASMNGAIPIVVGDTDEVMNIFKKEDNPPWIFASSWDEAVEICKKYLDDNNLLVEKQNSIITWYKKRITDIKKKIELVVNNI